LDFIFSDVIAVAYLIVSKVQYICYVWNLEMVMLYTLIT
jgi:hypothetical protein